MLFAVVVVSIVSWVSKRGLNYQYSEETELLIEDLPVLLPRIEDKIFIANAAELEEALGGAKSGDIEYMDGLADYYFRIGDVEQGEIWYSKSEQERLARGLPSKVDAVKFNFGKAKSDNP